MERYRKGIAVAILMLVFSALFLRNVRHDFPLIFKKDLLAHDESSNSVVAANTTRKFFPAMVRTNPLVEAQGNWMEGPFWQHIPPLFAYVPYVFFKLDGQVTIEVKRLSYAFLTLLTGLIFIFGVYSFRKRLFAAASAALSVIFWVNTPFTHELITGYAFGVSDIVLAFTVVCSFGAILRYLREESSERKKYSYKQLAIIGLVVALPILAKNLLGAIPAATFFGLLLYDHKKINDKILVAGGSFAGLLLVYFLPLFFSSPQTFKSEILLSFVHFTHLEGWGRPWHYYFTNYLPHRYLFGWTWIYFAGLVLGMGLLKKDLSFKILDRKDGILLSLSGGWFLWNLVAVSLVTSKIPNFIYQSYLLTLFFIIFAAITIVDRFFAPREMRNQLTAKVLAAVLLFSILAAGYETVRFANQFKLQRAQAYNYQTEREKFYQAAEEMKRLGLGAKDVIIIRVSDNDCWFRYYPLFLTGSEAKALIEMHFGYDADAIKQKYLRMYFVENKNGPDFNEKQRIELANYSLLEYNIGLMNASQIKSAVESFASFHKQDIQADIQRIKKDKTSCQWLIPDTILNTP